MKTKFSKTILALALACPGVVSLPAQQVVAPQSAADVPGTPSETVMTREYVQMVGQLAYIWGWPLVSHLNRSLGMANLPEPGHMGGVAPASPPGQISMLTDYVDAAEKILTCPNQDTVYGGGYQRLDQTPVVVQVPDFGDRFFVYQICDARTDAFASIGKQYGTKPGFYLLAGKNWQGEVPAGIREMVLKIILNILREEGRR